MAENIASSHERKVMIPLRVIKLFKRCIGDRSDVGKWYEVDEESMSTEADQKNTTHAYFVETLAQALQIFVPVARLQDIPAKNFRIPQPASTEPKINLNQFSHLEIQDIEEAAYETLQDASTSAPQPKKTRYQLEELDETQSGISHFLVYGIILKMYKASS